MSKIDKNTVVDNIRSYKDMTLDEVFSFIEDWLPSNYSSKVNKLLQDEDKVDPSYIRQVKKKKIKNHNIIYALYRVALSQKEKFELL